MESNGPGKKQKGGLTDPAGYGTVPGLFDGPDQAEQRTAGRKDQRDWRKGEKRAERQDNEEHGLGLLGSV